jgi:leucine dehydrogenase
VIAGSSNKQLGDDSLGDLLRAHGILWAPDFVANAGGLINVATELERGGYDPKRARERVRGIRDTLREIFDEAERTGTTPLTAAMLLARRRLGETVRAPQTQPARG